MKRYFVIADLHFGHHNVIEYCNRPYHNTFEMDNNLIKRWNQVVAKNDTVFVLGDVSLNKKPIIDYINQLNGEKILIKGNHDTFPNDFYREHGFKEVIKYPILFENYLLSHEPLVLNNTTPYFNYYGHVHNDPKYTDTPTSKCVSVERIDYKPLLILEK